MVEGSNFKSQILNTDFSNIETSKISEKTRIFSTKHLLVTQEEIRHGVKF